MSFFPNVKILRKTEISNVGISQDQYLESSLSLANLDLQGQKMSVFSNTQLLSLARIVYVKKGSTVLED